jgi:hypothetical protein
VRAIVPTVSNVSESNFAPARATHPKLGLKATMPQYEAGLINDPAVCVPIAKGTMLSATAAADPEEEPPGVCVKRSGLRV